MTDIEPSTPVLFDTHAHLVSDDWTRYPARAFAPGLPVPDRPGYRVSATDLIGMMDAENVARACLVQRGHIYGYDNACILDAARAHPDRFGAVVILDARDPATAPAYRDMVREGGVAGFRMAVSRPWIYDTDWLCSAEAIEVWRACADLGTPMTIIVFMNHLAHQLPLIAMLARMFPSLPILLDHGAMPYGMTQYEVGLAIERGETVVMPPPPHFGIDRTIAQFADIPNIHFKLTEINMERLTAANVRPARLVRRMVDEFGPHRLVWGSDIGQSMRWTYAEKTAMARAAAAFLEPHETQGFFHGNAARLYRMGC